MSEENDFDLKNIVLQLEDFGTAENFQQNMKIFLLRVTKAKTDIYKQEADAETKKILLETILKNAHENSFENREIIGYDSVNSKKNTHELVKVSSYQNISDMLAKFNDENQQFTSTSGMNESKFHSWLVSVNFNGHSYKVIGNYLNTLELEKKFLFGNFTDTKIDFSKSSSVFGFGKKIDLLIVDDEYVLINQAETKFENIFKMNKLFSEEATKILLNNEQIGNIFSKETREKLIEKVKNGKRMATRLISIVSDADTFRKTVEHISKITEITDDATHKFYEQVKDVKYENGQLSVEDGLEIQLINAISDAFVKAFISETERVDKTRL
ncbi:hypothetical protein [Lactococcus garvieae]|uniref:hypothetical protein n=1 Tax=Lactococcus garvieae TaxID=1363 RepID=UPI00385562D4